MPLIIASKSGPGISLQDEFPSNAFILLSNEANSLLQHVIAFVKMGFYLLFERNSCNS